MRQFLITKLVCSACGENLCLEYGKTSTTQHADGEPTGADKVELAVLVTPCNCMSRKLREVANAAKIISDMQEWIK